MRVVIDHVAGSRRGQRQDLSARDRIRFGRHPECEVAFDPQRDIDASSRHAELRPVPSGWVLVDLGSSNGTYVDGHRITEAIVAKDVPISIEFGPGGPRVRLVVGTAEEIATLPPPVVAVRRPAWLVPATAGVLGAALFVLLLMRC